MPDLLTITLEEKKQGDMLSRILNDTVEAQTYDPNEEAEQIKEIVDMADKSHVPIHTVQQNYDMFDTIKDSKWKISDSAKSDTFLSSLRKSEAQEIKDTQREKLGGIISVPLTKEELEAEEELKRHTAYQKMTNDQKWLYDNGYPQEFLPLLEKEPPIRRLAIAAGYIERPYSRSEKFEYNLKQLSPDVPFRKLVENYIDLREKYLSELVKKRVIDKPRKYKGWFDELGRNLARMGLKTYSGVFGTIATASESAIWDKESFQNLADWYYNASEIKPLSPGAGGPPIRQFTAQVIGSVIPYVAAGTTLSIITGSPYAAFFVGYSVEGDEIYRNTKRQGKSEEEAQMLRFIGGSINGAIETMQISGIIKFAKTGKGSFRAIAAAARNLAWTEFKAAGKDLTYSLAEHILREALEETLQEAVTTTAAIYTGEELTGEEIAKRLGMAAAGGAFMGLAFGGGGKILQEVTEGQGMTEAPVKIPEPFRIPEELEVTEKPAEVAKRRAVEILPRKKEILSEIDKAVEKAPDVADGTTVHFEIDGGADIINTKEALKNFRQRVQKMPETEMWPKKAGPKKPAKKKPVAAKREKVGELVKAPEGWFTDGRILVRGKEPAGVKRVEGWEGRPEVDIDDIIRTPTEPAQFQHYAVSDPSIGMGISDKPIAHIEEPGETGPLAVFKSGDKYFIYDQDKFNVIRNRYPDADYGIKADTGLLVAYMGKDNPVAAMMGITIDEAVGPGMKEPPVELEPLSEKPTEFMPEHKRVQPGLLIIESDIGEIHIPEADLTGKYGEDLEKVFYYGNFQSDVPQPKLERSLSVGDTIKYRGHTLMVMSQGWRDVTGLSDDAIEALQTSPNITLSATWRDAENRLKVQKAKKVTEAVFAVGERVTISDTPSTAHLTDAAGKTGTIIDIQMVRGKPISWAVDIDGIEYIVDAAKDMSPVVEKPTEEPSEFIPREVEHIENVVVDQFRSWPKDIKRVGKDYWAEVMAAAKRLATPYRYKALRRTMLGVFRYKKGVIPPKVTGIELQDVTDSLTATHELGHNIDWLLNNKVFPSSIKGRFPNTKVGEMTLRKELHKISQVLRPDMWERPRAYIKGHVELMADFVSHYILDPEKTLELAPNVTKAFEEKLAGNPELFETISRLQESRYEGPEEPPVAEHLKKEFPLPKEFKPLQLIIDMTQEDYVKSAEELGITAARHYKLLMHKAQTEADRIDKLVPNKSRQTDLVVIAENGEKNPWTGRTKEEILEEGLTKDEEKAITMFRGYQEDARQTVNKYLRGADIAEYISFIEDYFIHAYSTPMTEKYKTAITRWAKKSPQAKKRILPDLAKSIELGLKPRARTLSDGLRLWAGINYRVATNKAFLNILPKITNNDGVSIMQKPQDYPNWPTVDYWPIRQNYAKPLPNRGILLFQGRVAVDPQVKPFIDAMFGRKVFNTPVRIIEGLNATWKAFELTVFSLFHHAEEFFSAVGALGPRAMPFVGGYYGKRAQVFGKKKTFGILPERIGVLKAGKQLEKVPEFMEDYIAHGGQMGYISTEGINLMERMLKNIEDFLKDTIETKPLAGKAVWIPYIPAKTARAAYSWWQHLLWDNVQRAKLVTYYKIVSDGAQRSDLPIKDVKKTAVKYVNDNFGGQEWLNTIFRKPKTRQFWTQVMMSLDWTWSQIKTGTWPFRFGGETAQEKARLAMMRKIGRHHWFWYISAMAGFTVAGSFAFTGKGPWENEYGRRFDIDWTEIWRNLPWNRNWKQRADYSKRYISLGKAGRELVRWMTTPLKAFGNKLSPTARTMFEQGTGYNLGSTFSEPWAKEDMEFYQEIYSRFGHLMKNFVPFSLSGNNAFLAFPSRKGMTRWKAIKSYEEIFNVKANIACGGLTEALTKASHILDKDARRLNQEIIEACEINNVDADECMRYALARVRNKYYRLFWNATKRLDEVNCNKYAYALKKALDADKRGFEQSLRTRKSQLSREAIRMGRRYF